MEGSKSETWQQQTQIQVYKANHHLNQAPVRQQNTVKPQSNLPSAVGLISNLCSMNGLPHNGMLQSLAGIKGCCQPFSYRVPYGKYSKNLQVRTYIF